MFRREENIENALVRLSSGADFERFGNQYLRYFYKNQYPQTKVGLQIGSNSTVRGQPDGIFTLPDRTYIFAEYTKQQSDLVAKLKKDIQICLTKRKPGIDLAQIKHIDLVFASKLTNPSDEEVIAKPATDLGISVEFHNIDRLVNAVVDNFRLVRALNLPDDTGQILTIQEFVDQNEQGQLKIGTPLSNEFVDRAELAQLNELLTEHKLVVLKGPPGNGKTKLALTYLQHYTSAHPSSETYCIVNQPDAIRYDVRSCFVDGGHYVVLIDDANRQPENLLTLLSHLHSLKTATYQILITVRNYALNEVVQALRDNNYRHEQLLIGAMDRSQIAALLRGPQFDILNSEFQHRIYQLVQGNPRLAVMLAQLANRPDAYDITVLADVGALYEEYYSGAINDTTLWSNTTRLRVLGLSATQKSVDMNNANEFDPLLKLTGLTKVEWWQQAEHLGQAEIVELYRNSGYRFTEQTFATYAFYQCFFVKRVLSLSDLLAAYDEDSNISYRIKDAILGVLDSHDRTEIRQFLRPILSKRYASLTTNRARLTFLSQYERLMAHEALLFIDNYAQGRLTVEPKNRFGLTVNKEILDLLFAVLGSADNKGTSVVGYELVGALVAQQFVSAEDATKALEGYLQRYNTRNIDVYKSRFDQFDWLSEYLVEQETTGSVVHQQMMDALIVSFLLMHYENDDGAAFYSNRLFRYIDQRLEAGSEAVKTALFDYMPKGYGDLTEAEIQDDVDRVCYVIRKHFSPENPLDCLHVHRYVRKLDQVMLTQRTYASLKTMFNGKLYRLYCTLSQSHLRLQERIGYDFLDTEEHRAEKQAEIQSLLTFSNFDGFADAYDDIRSTWSLMMPPNNGWELADGFTTYLLLIAQQDKYLFQTIFRYLQTVGFPPRYLESSSLLSRVLESRAVTPTDAYKTLQPITAAKSSWLLTLLWALPEADITDSWLGILHNHLHMLAMQEPRQITVVGFLRKYIPLDLDLPNKVLKLLWERWKREDQESWVWDSFIVEFGSHIDIGLTQALEQIYLDQCFDRQAFDRKRKALAVLLDRRPGFWQDYLLAHYAPEGFRRHSFRQLSFIWAGEDYDKVIDQAIELIRKKKQYSIGSEELSGFFEQPSPEVIERIDLFVEQFIEQNSQDLEMLNVLYKALARAKLLKPSFMATFLRCNSSVDDFERIRWTSKTDDSIRSTRVNFGKHQAGLWKEVLDELHAISAPSKYLAHKQFVDNQITHALAPSEEEEWRQFFWGY